MSEISDFEKQFDKIVNKVNQVLDKSVRGAVLTTYKEVIEGTPVGNPTHWKNPSSAPRNYTGGTLRGNWQTTVSSPASGILNRKQDKESGSATDEAAKITNGYNMNSGSIYLTNNLPYVQAVNEGHFVQPGAELKWVDKAIAKFPTTLEQILKKNLT